MTGGNPFFLTEVLACDGVDVPATVRDAVLGRLARLSPKANRLLELVSVVPHKAERWVIEADTDGECAALDECIAANMLHLEAGAVGFRHELARQAVESALAPLHRQSLHSRVLCALLAHGEETVALARLVHHAVQADQRALVLRFAPAAAQQASAQGAHHEAVAHLVTALRYADSLDAEQRAGLLDTLTYERYLTGHFQDAIQPCETALAIWRSLARPEAMGHNLRLLSRLNWFLGNVAEAEETGLAAVNVLETVPPGHELVMAYGNMAHLRMLTNAATEAVMWGERAIALAEQLHDVETLSYALNSVGSAQLEDGDARGWDSLKRSLHLALEHGYEEHVARAYANLAECSVAQRDYAHAREYCLAGLAYCTEHDLGSWRHCLRGHLARISIDQGDWAQADEAASSILRSPWADGTNRLPALMHLGQLRARRGDPGAATLLDEARALAISTGQRASIIAVALIRAEWRWLQGDHVQCAAEAAQGFHLALAQHHPWYIGALARWCAARRFRGDGITFRGADGWRLARRCCALGTHGVSV